MKRPVVFMLLAVAVTPGFAGAAPEPQVAELLTRASAYVLEFVRRFSNVVSEEQYIQEAAATPRVTGSGFDRRFDQPTPVRRVLRSDFLLVRTEATADWNTFRDAFEVDGRPIRDRDERLMKLFAHSSADVAIQARRVADESGRYTLAAGRSINNPLMALGILQPSYQPRFQFSLGKPDKDAAPTVTVLEFKEQSRPTILHGLDNKDVPVYGRLWIETDTGRIVKSEIIAGGSDRVLTTFRFDERFGIAVPSEFRETFTIGRFAFEGRASYGQFRRFGVQTTETLKGEAR